MTHTDREEAWGREFDRIHAEVQTECAARYGNDVPPDTAPAAISGAEFLARLFGPTSEAPVYLSSLANAEDKAGEPGERHVFTRDPADIAAFMKKWDRPKRGLFFCVATMRPDGGRRAKENAAEIVVLHADVDTKDIDLSVDEILRRLGQLRLLPTWVVLTGHGFHLYWVLREALPATPETIERVEACLRLLCEHVGGDRACNEISRLMRLPGSHNSKRGEWLPVEALLERPNKRYELDEVEDWICEAAPLIRRRNEEAQAADNPWLAVAARFGIKPPVDVEQRLAAMAYGGTGEAAVHPTQVSVTAALLNRGHPLEEVVDTVLTATRAAAGAYGERWNWIREERAVRKMCTDWLTKHPEIAGRAAAAAAAEEPAAAAATATDEATATGEDATAAQATGTDDVISLAQERATRQKSKAKTKSKTAGPHAAVPIAIADGVIEIVRANGGDLLLTGGDLHLYEAGIWRVAEGADEQWLRALVQQGCEALGEGARLSIVGAAWKRLNEHPGLHRRSVAWDRRGLAATANGVLDLQTHKFMAWDPEHYLRRKLAIAYDPARTCPQFLAFMASLFADRDEATRAQVVALLQEVLGACLGTPLLNREQRRALLMSGPSPPASPSSQRSSGCWSANPVASPAVSEIGERFGLATFYGACAWIRDDAVNEGDRINPERFKTIVTGEPIDIERKNRAPLRQVRLAIPVVLTANSLPTSRDSSDAIFNRSLVVELTNVFDEEAAEKARRAHGIVRPGQTLGDWLFEQEGPGIFNWALAGLARLLGRGRYAIPDLVRKAIQGFRDDSNPVAEWARRMLEPAVDCKIERSDLLCSFHGWWREEMGDSVRLPGGRWFVPKLRAACPHARTVTVMGARYAGGIKLNKEGLQYWTRQSADAAQRGHGSRGTASSAKDVNQAWTVTDAANASND